MTKDQIRDSLKQAGYWKDFVVLREKYKKEGGLAPAKAFDAAWKDIQQRIIKAPFPRSVATPALRTVMPSSPPAASTPAASSPSTTPLPATPTHPTPAPVILPPTTASPVSRRKKQPKPNVGDDADWVYVTLPVVIEAAKHGTPLAEYPTPPPSPGALGLLTWAGGNAEKFYELYLARRLPNRTAIDADDKKGESGRSVQELARELDNAIADTDPDEFSLESPADDEGEPSVSPETDGESGEG